jgi:hypothetical protein
MRKQIDAPKQDFSCGKLISYHGIFRAEDRALNEITASNTCPPFESARAALSISHKHVNVNLFTVIPPKPNTRRNIEHIERHTEKKDHQSL